MGKFGKSEAKQEAKKAMKTEEVMKETARMLGRTTPMSGRKAAKLVREANDRGIG